jgi:aspartyl-tRNA(Asn)/glutamyl-tRNA(Gln) amidotransferase subunit C
MSDSSSDLEHVDIRYVADLARIALTDEEAARLEGELDQVLAYVRKLEELDLEGLEPMSHPHPQENVLREDVPVAGPEPEALMRNAPSQLQGLVRVPQMMEDT